LFRTILENIEVNSINITNIIICYATLYREGST